MASFPQLRSTNPTSGGTRLIISLSWLGLPEQHQTNKKRFRAVRRGASARELHRDLSLRFLAKGYNLISESI